MEEGRGRESSPLATGTLQQWRAPTAGPDPAAGWEAGREAASSRRTVEAGPPRRAPLVSGRSDGCWWGRRRRREGGASAAASLDPAAGREGRRGGGERDGRERVV